MMNGRTLNRGGTMQIPVLVVPVANNGFRAKSGEPMQFSAEGATPEEAVGNLRFAIVQQLKNGSQLLSLEIAPENPWLALAGVYNADDPMVQEWKLEMAAYRQEVED